MRRIYRKIDLKEKANIQEKKKTNNKPNPKPKHKQINNITDKNHRESTSSQRKKISNNKMKSKEIKN